MLFSASKSHCGTCHKPLDHNVPHQDEAGAATVPDDLELECGCHFHWECMMGAASRVALSLKCPACSMFVVVGKEWPSITEGFLDTLSGVIMAKYRSAGGRQEDVDLLPILTEAVYMKSCPEARLPRALHLLCAKGDVAGMLELLDQNPKPEELVLSTDPMNNHCGLLHVAVDKQQEKAVWLLLWLASGLPTNAFPSAAREAIEAMNLSRMHTGQSSDIRNKKDCLGRTAEQIARQKPEAWAALLEAGVLAEPDRSAM